MLHLFETEVIIMSRCLLSWRVWAGGVGRCWATRGCHNAVPLTAEHYNVKRGDYATVGPIMQGPLLACIILVFQVSHLDVEEFRGVVGAEHVLTSASDVEPYNVDWLQNHR